MAARGTIKKAFLGDIQSAEGTRDTGLTFADNGLNLLSESMIREAITSSPNDSASPTLATEPDSIDSIGAQGTLATYLRQPGVLSSPPVAGELPRELDVLLRQSGWQRVIPASGKWSTYYYTGEPDEFGTIEQYDILDNGKMNLTTAWNTISNWALEMEANSKIIYRASGLVGRLGNLTEATEGGGTWGGTIGYAGGKPAVFNGAPTQLINLSDDSVYGGGSLASPNYDLCLQSMTLESNRGVEAIACPAADGGIRGGRGGYGAPTAQVVIESTDVDVYNPKALRIAQTPVCIRSKVPLGVTGLYVWVVYYGWIVDVSDPSLVGNRQLHTLTIRTTAPEDASDGDPATGEDPGQKFTAGTNAGLPNSDGANAPSGARVALQIVDEN